MKDQFTAAEFMDGRNSRADGMREDYCKYAGCKHRKKHKCAKHCCRIVNAPCDPVAEYMRKKGERKMITEVKCTECGEVVTPVEINAPALEAKCSKCGEWFCYADYELRSDNHKRDDGTEMCKRIYDGGNRWQS